MFLVCDFAWWLSTSSSTARLIFKHEGWQQTRVEPTGAVGIHEAAGREEHTTGIEMGLRKDIADGSGNSNSPKQGLQSGEKREYAI